MSLSRRIVRTAFTFLNGRRLALRKMTGLGRAGVHAVPLTESGKVVLVRLTYAPGWRVPGGGRKRGEAPEQAMLRELREEIGLVSHGAVERLEEGQPGSDESESRSAFFVVRDVVYRPRRSLEVEEVREFDPRELPADTTRWTAHLIERHGRF
ncbi:MAG TPA: NUDIX domain-containing protein [Allosphingosinicella sp.]|nr:NUDIX domain-containing protein [Allosphingosinicella sp.]